MKLLIAVSEHENWIQVDKSICGSDPFTVDLRGRAGEEVEGEPLQLFHTVSAHKGVFTLLSLKERDFISPPGRVCFYFLLR